MNFNDDPDDDDDFVAEYDDNGRPIKEYKPRLHPFKEWGERHFQRRYRLPKAVAKDLCRDFARWTPYEWLPNAGAISLEDRFCLGLRYLATGANYSPLSSTQGVSKSTVTRCLDHVLDYFSDQYQRYIKFPENNYEMMQASVEWRDLVTGLHRCIGAMDGTHIAIIKPTLEENAYVNRKGWHSLNCMVICDSRQRIIHLDAQHPGSVSDQRVYNLSELRDYSDDGGLDDFYLLADSGYRVRKNVFPPVQNPTTDAEEAYNAWHRSCRSIIERTIGIWKQRWRCLDSSAGYLYHTPAKCSKIAIATACLHNICINHNVPMEEDDHFDGYQPVQLPLQQPNQLIPLQDHLDTRTNYINRFFIGPDANN